MKDELMVVIYVATEDKEFNIPLSSNCSIEDLCIQVCVHDILIYLLDRQT